MSDIKKLLDFFKIAGELKRTIRYASDRGALVRDSVADHSWRLALMALIIADNRELNIDPAKAVKLALVHDLAESITGDIDATTIGRKISKEQKDRNEKKAMDQLLNDCPKKTKKMLTESWNEFLAGRTREARFVKALDKIETMMHLYETGYKGKNYAHFTHAYGDKAVKNFPELAAWLAAIKIKLKNEFIKNGNWK